MSKVGLIFNRLTKFLSGTSLLISFILFYTATSLIFYLILVNIHKKCAHLFLRSSPAESLWKCQCPMTEGIWVSLCSSECLEHRQVFLDIEEENISYSGQFTETNQQNILLILCFKPFQIFFCAIGFYWDYWHFMIVVAKLQILALLHCFSKINLQP